MEISAKRRTGIFGVILVTCIVCTMLSTALNTALPQIMIDFEVTTNTGQWLTSIYSLVMGILVLATPFLIRRIKTKLLYLATLAVFIAGLFLCAFTTSFTVMLAGRVLQAAGNGVMVSLGQVILLTVYPKEKRGSIMGVYGLAIGAAPVLAPTLAGIIVDAFGWRMIFYFMLIISALAWLLVVLVFENLLDVGKEKFDFLSLVLCAAGYSGILMGAGNLGSYPFISFSVLLPLLLGLTAAGIFVYQQLHMRTPFLELRILKVKGYRIAVIASMLMYSSMMAASILLPVYVQNVRGYSATISGLVTMPGSLAMALTSPFAGKTYDKAGIKRVFLPGAALLALSSLGMVFTGEAAPLVWIALLNVFRSIAIGCMMMPFVTWGMSGLDEEYTSHGTALLTSLRTVAGSFGSAIFVSLVSMVAAVSTQSTGINIAFLGLTIIGVVEFGLAVYVAKKNI